MGYVEDLRQLVGNQPLILVRPSVAIINQDGHGHEYYNVIINYICTQFTGEITPDGEEGLEAQFFGLSEVPESTQPFIKDKLGPTLGRLL